MLLFTLTAHKDKYTNSVSQKQITDLYLVSKFVKLSDELNIYIGVCLKIASNLKKTVIVCDTKLPASL